MTGIQRDSSRVESLRTPARPTLATPAVDWLLRPFPPAVDDIPGLPGPFTPRTSSGVAASLAGTAAAGLAVLGGQAEVTARAAAAAAIPPTVTGVTERDAPRAGGPVFRVRTVASGFDSPVQVTHAPGDSALYVVEQSGKIYRQNGARRTEMIDLSSRIKGGGEQGLLSVAFHPDFQRNGRLFVNYTDKTGDTHVSELRRRGKRFDPASHKDLMVIAQPYSNHNGGQLQFGPDGSLYIGMGDGGAGGDPQARAQNPREHLGKLLRIDVNRSEGGRPYAVPRDNPYASGTGGQPEIYASGLRNPWRFSFDRSTGDLWMGDVGQNSWEEVNFTPAGQARNGNFGWDVREGANPFERKPFGPGKVIDPVLQYSDGSSVIGGYVYRGSDIPSLRGYYLHADINKSAVRAFKIEDGRVTDRREFPVPDARMIVSFGEDERGEMYLTTFDGKLMKFEPKDATGPSGPTPPGPAAPAGKVVNLQVSPGKNRFTVPRQDGVGGSGAGTAQPAIRVPAGDVTLRFTNNETNGMVHNVAVRGNGVRAFGDIIGPGQSSEVRVRLEAGKRYTLFCGPHEGYGMVGTIIAE